MIISLIVLSTMILLRLIIDNIDLTLINIKEIIHNEFNINIKETQQIVTKLYNIPSNILTILLINYLFLTLIVVVKVTNFFYGPLRNIN